MNDKDLEFRYETVDLRTAPNSRYIEGRAICFNSPSPNREGWVEIIDPNAITDELIQKSDIVLNYNHSNDKILARSRYGQGSMKVTRTDAGVDFFTEVPNTDLGTYILEMNRRGDIRDCSFAFAIDPNDGDKWERRADGTIVRTITHIIYLADLSLVTTGYYTEPSFSQRSLDKFNELMNNMLEEKQEPEKEIQDDDQEKVDETEEKVAEKVEDEEQHEPENEEDTQDEAHDEEEKAEKEVDEQHNEEKNINKNKTHNIMEKRFSLLSAIRSVANGRQMDEATQAVVNLGADEMKRAGVEVTGQIQLPTEMRAAITVTAEGDDVVVTDFTNILEPLYKKNVLSDLGAHILTGLVGDVQIPIMSAGNVYWEGEVTTAKDGAGAFSNVKMQPHRLSAFIDISKQFLAQDSLGAEELIRRDLINAIQQKLEDTIFTADAASGNIPAGIFNGVTAEEVADYAGICDLEANLEDANVYGPYKYLLTPSAKAKLRSMIKGTNATGMVLENGEVDGVPAYSTGHMTAGDIAFGAWDNLYVGQWGAIDLTVDPYTQAADGKIRLVINAFFDYKLVRPAAVVLANFEE